MKFTIAHVVIIAAISSMVQPSISFADTDCSKFTEPSFFQEATVEDTRRCIKKGVDLFSRSSNGETPLHWAAGYATNPDIIDALLVSIKDEEGQENYINARNKDGKSAMHLAAEVGLDPAILVRLASWTADVNAQYNIIDPFWGEKLGTTPLHLAINRESAEPMVTTLLALGADPTLKDKKGISPLHYEAKKASNTRLLALLLIHASPNIKTTKGSTPLHVASTSNNNLHITNYLISRGAEVNIENDAGQTPLQFAAGYNKNPEVVERLFNLTESPCEEDEDDRSAYVNIKNNDALKNTPAYWKLHEACFEKD